MLAEPSAAWVVLVEEGLAPPVAFPRAETCYEVQVEGHFSPLEQSGEESNGRGPAGPLPWSLGEGVQGEGESKRPHPGGS